MKTSLIIVSAPSGAGKSSLCERALKEFPKLVDCITYTTRAPRPTESEGNPYHFVTRQKFEELREKNFFAEWANVHNHYYGTPIDQIEKAAQDGNVIIMDIDVQGAATLVKKYPAAKTIFILPPSLDELRRRLEFRDKGKTYDIELRLENAKKEMTQASKFNYRVINSDFESAYGELKKIIEEILKFR